MNIDNYNKYRKENHPNMNPFEHERWLPIILPMVDPNAYQISSWGRVYSNISRMFLTTAERSGYYCVTLMTIDDQRLQIDVHRLVAMAFIPRYNVYQDTVNHIDGVKKNNVVTNLEWVTQQQNVEHGLLLELSSNKINPTDKDIHFICKSLQEGKSFDEIVHVLIQGNPKYDKDYISSIVAAIRHKRYRTDISKLYNIDHNNSHSTANYTISDIHKICGMLQAGTSIECLMKEFGVSEENRVDFQMYISKICRKLIFKGISDQYIIQYPEGMHPKTTRLNDEQIAKIIECLKQGKNSREIYIDLFNASPSDIPRAKFLSFKRSIQNIKKKYLK